jgi:hypothetical protein
MVTANRPKSVPAGAAKPASKAASPSQRRSAKAVKKQLPSPRKDLLAELEMIMENPGLWLDSPNSLIGGRTPSEVIGTEDEKLLREWIGSVKHGMVS